MALTNTVRIRLLLDEEIAMGPGKANLLEAISKTGSISAAAKSLDMSYRRAWLLVDTMNACFDPPLIVAAKGGPGGGGAQITETGLSVLAAFRELQRDVGALVTARRDKFSKHLRKPKPRAKRAR